MNFSVTEQGSYKRCERQAVLTSKNGQHIGQIFPPLSLSLGSLMHRSHQLWVIAEDPAAKTLQQHCLDASIEMIEHAKTRYKAQVGCLPSDSEMSSLYESVEFGVAMSELYQLRYGQPLPDDYILLAAEQKIEIPVKGTEHPCPDCNGEGFRDNNQHDEGVCSGECSTAGDDIEPGTARHKLEGRLDGLTQHKTTGQVRILERKTYNSRPKEDQLKKNDQFLQYDWMVRQLGFNPDQGVATLYDGQWRRKEAPRGKTFEDLFARWVLVERNQHERDEFEQKLPRRLNAMYELYSHEDALGHADTNRRWQGCYDCGVEDLCYNITRGISIDSLMQSKYTSRSDDIEETEEPAE